MWVYVHMYLYVYTLTRNHVYKPLRMSYIPCRLALLLQLANAVGATWVVEQPRGSLLFEHDRLSELVESWMGRVNETRLGRF